MYYVTEINVHYCANQLTVEQEVNCLSSLYLLERILLTQMCCNVNIVNGAAVLSLGNRRHSRSYKENL